MVQKNHFIDSVTTLNSTFTDSGLFGIQLTGSADQGNNALTLATAELKGLTSTISAEELARAKAVLKTDVLFALERQGDRLEEAAKNVLTHGKVVLNNYVENIDKVTAE